LATKKTKTEQESGELTSKSVKTTTDETAKKPAVKKAAEKTAEPKPATKTAAQKEEKPATVKKVKVAPAVAKQQAEPAPKKVATKKKAATETPAPAAVVSETPNEKEPGSVKITFQLKYSTRFGQRIFITGNNDILGNGNIEKALPLQYFNHEYWYAEVQLPVTTKNIAYNYLVVNEDGSILREEGSENVLNTGKLNADEVLIADTWNAAAHENTLFSEPSDEVHVIETNTKKYTHTFKVQAPALSKNDVIFIAGNTDELGNWTQENIKLLSRKDGFWTINVDLSEAAFPITYKYGVYNTAENKFVEFEAGDNRILYGSADPKKLTIISDGILYLTTISLRVAV